MTIVQRLLVALHLIRPPAEEPKWAVPAFTSSPPAPAALPQAGTERIATEGARTRMAEMERRLSKTFNGSLDKHKADMAEIEEATKELRESSSAKNKSVRE